MQRCKPSEGGLEEASQPTKFLKVRDPAFCKGENNEEAGEEGCKTHISELYFRVLSNIIPE